MGKNNVRLYIFDTEYIISSDNDESYIRQTALNVENKIRLMLKENPKLSTMTASILAAMDYCDDAKKSFDSSNNIRNQIKKYIDENNKIRIENEKMKVNLKKLTEEIENLRMRLNNKPNSVNVQKNNNTSVNSSVNKSPSASYDTIDNSNSPNKEILNFFDKNDND